MQKLHKWYLRGVFQAGCLFDSSRVTEWVITRGILRYYQPCDLISVAIAGRLENVVLELLPYYMAKNYWNGKYLEVSFRAEGMYKAHDRMTELSLR